MFPLWVNGSFKLFILLQVFYQCVTMGKVMVGFKTDEILHNNAARGETWFARYADFSERSICGAGWVTFRIAMK
jgi:hypothetical protein